MSDGYVAGYDAAVLPVLSWVQSSDWVGTYADHASDFYSELVEAFDEPIFDILARMPTPLWARAMRCCFDDFLTVEYDSSPRNVLDQYLDEIGMDLEEADVDFLIAFRTSVVRVYYVVERIPYESVVLRDLSGGTRPIKIEDEMLTAALAPGDNIATRIVTIGDKDYLAGSILVLTDDTLETFKHAFEYAFKEELRGVEKYLQKDLRQRNLARLRVLKGAAGAVSAMWVGSVLIAMEETPSLALEDDPETVFQANIPYDSALEPIVECLDAHPDLHRPIAKEFIWVWHSDRTAHEASLKALVWISGPDIYIESCERSRIEDAVGNLQGLLGDVVGEATIRDVGSDDEWDDLEDIDEYEDDFPRLPAPMTDEEEAEFRERVHQFLDLQFRAMLDDSVPELKDQIPRELAKTVKGRGQLRKWLASLEANLQASKQKIGLADYDLRWMWKELGMETERQSNLFE